MACTFIRQLGPRNKYYYLSAASIALWVYPYARRLYLHQITLEYGRHLVHNPPLGNQLEQHISPACGSLFPSSC